MQLVVGFQNDTAELRQAHPPKSNLPAFRASADESLRRVGVSEREWKAVWDDEKDISSEELQKHGMTAEAPISSYRYAARIAPHGSR